jgi:hypothetical protein
MKQIVTRRAAGVLAATAVAVVLACSDSSPSEPSPRSSKSEGGGSLANDTATTGGGPVGNPTDTGRSGNPAPKPVASYTLVVHTGTPRAGVADTLLTDPLAGASVSVTERGYVFTPGNGHDTLTFTETVVATATSDANGDVSFPNLKGASTYVVKATAPAGLALTAPTVIIPLAYSDVIKTTLVFRKP